MLVKKGFGSPSECQCIDRAARLLRVIAVPVFYQPRRHGHGRGSLICGGQKTGGAGSALQQQIEKHQVARICYTALRPADSQHSSGMNSAKEFLRSVSTVER